MRFGVYTEMQCPLDKPHEQLYWETQRQIDHADEMRFDVYSTIDHHFARVRHLGNPLALFCAVAQRARRIRFRTALRHDLLRDGRYALQTFPQPKAGSDEFYMAGRAVLVDDAVARAVVLRDARHMATASESVFELSIECVMHTRWEDPLIAQMRPVQRKWRAPWSAGAFRETTP